MARIPITVMGCRCERCGAEWIPRNLSLNRTLPQVQKPVLEHS